MLTHIKHAYLEGNICPIESESGRIVNGEGGGAGGGGGDNIIGGAPVAAYDLPQKGVAWGEVRHRVRVPHLPRPKTSKLVYMYA